MRRSLAFGFLLAVGLAMPAVAQQLTDQEARKIAETIEQAWEKGFQDRSPAALAALYSRDAIRISGNGETQVGPAAIETFYTGLTKAWDADPNKLEQVKALGNDVIVVTGAWSGTWHGEKGPIKFSGHFANTDIREGDGWKIALFIVSNAPAQ